MANAMAERPQHRRDSGFTLFELLISLAILGLVVVLLTGGVRFAGRAWDAQQNRAATQDDLTAVQSLLRSMIAAGHGFNGGVASLQFVGIMPRALERAGLYDIDLATFGNQLVINWQPHKRPGFSPPPSQQTELARGIVSLDLRYFLWDDAKQVGAWTSSASDPKKPPALIQIGLALPDGDRRLWPPLVIAPMVNDEGK
jgi:general secretion pathway protein J